MSFWKKTRYNWTFFWSAAALLGERFWNAFWPALSVLALFVGLSCLNMLTAFGPGAHLVLLFLFVTGFTLAATRLGAGFRMPAGGEIRRAIERESGMTHRPLEALLDRPVEGSTLEARRLWQKYQERLARLQEGAKAYRPRPDAAPRDPYSLRHAALAVLALGLLIAQRDAGLRLRQALHVDVTHWIHAAPVAFDAWITPPAYTGQAPLFLATTKLGAGAYKGRVEAPENSVLKVRISGYSSPPAVTYGGKPAPAFAEPAPHSFTLEMPLLTSGELVIKKNFFRKLGAWPVTVIADLPPEISYLGLMPEDPAAPKAQQAKLQIRYSAKDDYGITSLSGLILPTAELQKAVGNRQINFDIPVPGELQTARGDAKDEQLYAADLTSHPWAGAEVMLSLAATDAAGHVTETEPVKVRLPERKFTNPTAQRIIAARKRLIWYENFLTDKAVAGDLIDIASSPGDYRDDEITYLGLYMAAKRLAYDGGPESVESTVALLWNLAVRVEDGGLSLAARDLSDAMQKLIEALHDPNTPKEKLQELMQQFSQALREYMKTYMAEMQQMMKQQNGNKAEELSPEMMAKLMKYVDMKKIMEQLREMSKGSEREQMEKMLRQMQKSVDNFDPEQQERMRQQQSKMAKALNDLEKLIQRQQSLLDHTNRMEQGRGQQQHQDGKQGQNPPQQQGRQGQQKGQQQDSGNAQAGPSRQNGDNDGPQGTGPDSAGQDSASPGDNGNGGQDQSAQQAGGDGAEPPNSFPQVGNPKEGATEQGAIRDKFGDVMRQMGDMMPELPDNFPKADQGMKESQQALQQGNVPGSAADQREVLKNLQQAEDSLLQQMGQNMQAMLSLFGPPGGQGEGYGRGFDPLGREEGGPGAGRVDLPTEKERRRVQQIIEELRSRSNDYQRPQIERDYIDRLLDTF